MSGPELFGVRPNSFEGLCWENTFIGVITVFQTQPGIWPLEPPGALVSVSMRYKPLNPVNSLPRPPPHMCRFPEDRRGSETPAALRRRCLEWRILETSFGLGSATLCPEP